MANVTTAWITALLLTAFVCGQSGAQTVTGRVVDAGTDRPLSGVRFVLSPAAAFDPRVLTTMSDSLGNFQFVLERSDTFRIQASQLGYETAVHEVFLAVDSAHHLSISLSADPLVLGRIEVTARRRPVLGVDPFGEIRTRRQIYGIEGTGVGFFLDASDIEVIAPVALTDVLSRTPGYRMKSAGVRLQPQSRCNKDPVYFVNGRRYAPTRRKGELNEIQNQYHMAHLAAVEVYRVTWQAPIEYQTTADGCGVVAFWFRSGERSAGAAEEIRSGELPKVRVGAAMGLTLGDLDSRARTETVLQTFPLATLDFEYKTFGRLSTHASAQLAPRVVMAVSPRYGQSTLIHRGQLWSARGKLALALLDGDRLVGDLSLGVSLFRTPDLDLNACNASEELCSAMDQAARRRIRPMLALGINGRAWGRLGWQVSSTLARWDRNPMQTFIAGATWGIW